MNETNFPDHTSVISVDPKYGSLRDHLLEKPDSIKTNLFERGSKQVIFQEPTKIIIDRRGLEGKRQEFSFADNLHGPVSKDHLTDVIQKEINQIHISCKDLKGLIQKGAEESGFWCIKPQRVHELAELLDDDIDVTDGYKKCEKRKSVEAKLIKIFKKVFNAVSFILQTKKEISLREKRNNPFSKSSGMPLVKENQGAPELKKETRFERLLNNTKIMVIFYCFILALAAAGVFIYGFFMPTNKFKATADYIGIGINFAFAGKIGVIFVVDAMFCLMYRDVLTMLRKIRLVGKYFNVLLNEHVTLHKFMGYILLAFSVVHALGHLIGTFVKISECDDLAALNSLTTKGKFEYLPNYVDLLFKTIPGLTGILMLIILFLIVLSSFEFVKRRYYQIFGYSHILYLAFVILLYIHGSMFLFNYGIPYSVIYITPFFAIGLLHHVKKWVQFSQKSTIIDVSFSAKNSVAYVKILKPNHFNIIPGQYLFINVPSISYFQWHPFSICSIGANGVVKLMVKNAGDFTDLLLAQLFKAKSDFIVENNLEVGSKKKFQELYYDFLLKEEDVFKIVNIGEKTKLPKYPKIGLYGPITAPAVGAFNSRNVVFIGSGVGISPYIVFLDEYINFLKQEKKKSKNPTKQYFHDLNSFNRDVLLTNYKTSKFLSEIRMSYMQGGMKSDQVKIFFKDFEKISFYFIARDCDQLSWITYYLLKLIKYNYNTEKLDIKLFLTTPKDQITSLSSYLFWRALGKYQKKKDSCRVKSCIDFLSNLPIQVIYKRPEFEKYFEESRQKQTTPKDFHVYACGPSQMLDSIGKACEKTNQKGEAKFVFFPEKF